MESEFNARHRQGLFTPSGEQGRQGEEKISRKKQHFKSDFHFPRYFYKQTQFKQEELFRQMQIFELKINELISYGQRL